MKKSVKSSMVVLALGLGLSIGTSDEVEAIDNSPYAYFNGEGIRTELPGYLENAYYNHYQIEMEKLSDDHSKGLISDDEFNRLQEKLMEEEEATSIERATLYNEYGLFKKTDIQKITDFDADFDEYSSLAGFEQMISLKSIGGEGGTFNSFREISSLTTLKSFSLEASNQLTLNSFKNLVNLERLDLYFKGYENNDEPSEQGYTQVLTTDISALSNLNKLKSIGISARGRMATITLKKGTTSYQLFDPIVPSKQFDGAEMKYSSDIQSGEWLEWNDLKGDEKHLEFSWNIAKGRAMFYTGEGQIPIRWKE